LAEEDPKIFKSIKTGRGPLNECWIENCISNKLPLMCAYKLCKVEFKYWGLQTRGERWIHELALRVIFWKFVDGKGNWNFVKKKFF